MVADRGGNPVSTVKGVVSGGKSAVSLVQALNLPMAVLTALELA
jgi:hypothetical protein